MVTFTRRPRPPRDKGLLRQVLCHGVALLMAAVGSLTAVGVAQAPADVRLADLTVPATRLPEGCTMPANEPIDPRGMTRLPAGATNPWSPTESRDLAMVHHLVAGVPRVPDGPPLTTREARRFGQLNPDIAAAYAAVYAASGEPDIRVWALRYASTLPPVAEGRAPYRVREQFTAGRVLVLIDASDRGPCFEAVRLYLRSLMKR